MRFAFALVLLVAAPVAAQDTGSISGIISDADTGEPLIGANIYIPAAQHGAATDIDGTYAIVGVPPGTYTVRVSYAGFETTEIDDVVIQFAQRRTLDAALEGSDLDWVCYFERPFFSYDIYQPRVSLGEQIRDLPTAR